MIQIIPGLSWAECRGSVYCFNSILNFACQANGTDGMNIADSVQQQASGKQLNNKLACDLSPCDVNAVEIS